MEAPELDKTIPASEPCVTDVLCIGKLKSVCGHFQPHKSGPPSVASLRHMQAPQVSHCHRVVALHSW